MTFIHWLGLLAVSDTSLGVRGRVWRETEIESKRERERELQSAREHSIRKLGECIRR